MKAQLILLSLLATLLSTKGFAVNKDSKQKEKKTLKSKYDFNIIKLYSLSVGQEHPDSLNVEIKALPPKRKEN